MVNPPWRTPAVVELAKEISNKRDDSLSPVLADALEEAGAPEWLYNHFRGVSQHEVSICRHLPCLLKEDYEWE